MTRCAAMMYARSAPARMIGLLSAAVLSAALVACSPAVPGGTAAEPQRDATDSARVVTMLLQLEQVKPKAPAAWPGFDLDSLVLIASLRPRGPVFLMGDPAPPTGFKQIRRGHGIYAQSVVPPDSLSVRLAMDWNGRRGVGTALSVEDVTIKYLPFLLVHEAFHTFQMLRSRAHPAEFREFSSPRFPVDSVEAMALLHLEGRYLGEALGAVELDSSRALARRALVVRGYRCARLGVSECESERGVEQFEGSANWVAAEVLGYIAGYGRDATSQESLMAAIATVEKVERLARWHFYDTGYAWIRLIERFSAGGEWKSRVAISPPDLVLGRILGVDLTDTAAIAGSIESDVRWSGAYRAAADLVARQPASSESDVPVRIYFGRITSHTLDESRLADGQTQRRILFNGNEVLFTGPSREFCCPAGELTMAPVQGKTARVDGRDIALDRAATVTGELHFDLGAVAVRMLRAELRVFADSITVQALHRQ